MPIRLFASGETPSAADFNRYFLQQHSIVKPSDESRTSTTVLTADSHLTFATTASTDYWVWCLIFYTGLNGNGLKLNWDGPSGSSFDWISDGLGSAATGSVDIVSRNLQSLSTTPAPATLGTNTVVPIKGLLRVAGNSGNFFLTWAQLNSSATATTIYAGSTLIVRRLTS